MRTTLGQAAEVRLGRQRAPQFERGDHVVRYLRSANVQDGRLELSDVKQMNFTLAEQAIFGLVPGDVLVTEGSGSRETVGVSAVWRHDMDGPVCFQNTLLRLRPRPGLTDGRYLAWWARYARTSGQVAAVSSGANIFHVGSDGLKALPVVLPDLQAQRRIADFLDDRVARIDRIIVARRTQQQAVGEHETASIQRLIDERSTRERRRLQDFTDARRPIQYGIVLPGPHFEGGVPIIKGGDIGSGRLGRLELNRTDPAIEQNYKRSRVRPGDYVVAIRGSVGEVDEIPPALALANLTQDSARIAPSGCDPQWLLAVLRSKGVQSEMSSLMTGSTVRGINIEALRRVSIPVASTDEQIIIGREGAALQRSAAAHRTGLTRSVDLLRELKQSLIAAAVTGELDVTAASTRIPE